MARRESRLQLVLIGAGQMGSYHARVIAQSHRADLACIVDPDESRGAPLADRFDSRWVPKLDDLGPFDAAIVACPTENHVVWARHAIEAGRPVLIEKPASEDAEEVASLIADAERHGLPIMCGLLERFNPAIMTMLDIIDAPVHVTAVRHSPYVDRIETGVAYDLLIHDVDLVVRMAGMMPSDVKAHFGFVHPKSSSRCEDVAEASLLFGDTLVAALSASRVSQRKIRTLEVAELERLVEVDLVRQDITVYRHVGADFLDGSQTGYRQQTVIDIPAIEYGREPLAAQLDHFVDLIREDADADLERVSLLAPHQVVAAIVDAARAPSF